MDARGVRALVGLVGALSATMLSCGVSSSLLSDAERSSLYSIKLNSSDGKEIVNGSVLAPGSRIIPALSKLPGAADPGSFEIELVGRGGQSAVGAATRDTIGDGLPAIAVPASAPPGTYTIATKVIGKNGEVDLAAKRTVFIGLAAPVIESATSFPPSIEPGAPALLGLSIAYPADVAAGAVGATDPWIEWSANGAVFAAGLLSDGFDKVVWNAPRAAGAYSVAVQAYPAAPLEPSGFGFPAAPESRKTVNVMAIANPAGSGDDFADPLSFFSLLRLDGDFSDAGTRPRSVGPEAFGSPQLDVYAGGFGYRFGQDAGVRIPGLMPPAKGDRLAAFSVLVRVAPRDEDGTGSVATFVSDDGKYSLTIGLDAWKPYVEFAFDGTIRRSAASDAIPISPLTLHVSFVPTGERLVVRWYADGERITLPSMPLPPPPGPGGAIVGGPLSLAGVYDGFGLSVGSVSPSYRLAARRRWRSSLIYAEGFENGALPGASTDGVGATAEGLALESGALLPLIRSFEPGEGVAIEASFVGDRSSARLIFARPGGAALFSVGGTGRVEDASGAAIGVVSVGSSPLSFTVAASEKGVVLRGVAGDTVVAPGGSAELGLSVSRAQGASQLSLDRILVRRSPVPRAAEQESRNL